MATSRTGNDWLVRDFDGSVNARCRFGRALVVLIRSPCIKDGISSECQEMIVTSRDINDDRSRESRNRSTFGERRQGRIANPVMKRAILCDSNRSKGRSGDARKPHTAQRNGQIKGSDSRRQVFRSFRISRVLSNVWDSANRVGVGRRNGFEGWC